MGSEVKFRSLDFLKSFYAVKYLGPLPFWSMHLLVSGDSLFARQMIKCKQIFNGRVRGSSWKTLEEN